LIMIILQSVFSGFCHPPPLHSFPTRRSSDLISYCSCRNRHCPKCHGQARARWLEQRAAELLPVEYFHVVFTVPQLVAPLALRNQRVVYGILFRAAAETLLQIAADSKHLAARIG